MPTFPCYQCGRCCQNVHLAAETQFLDRGDGTCRHFDALAKNCSIYEHRPDICRVDLQYQLNYRVHYTWEKFIAVNLQACEQLSKLSVRES